MQSTLNSTPSEESIRFRAYILWEADGRQHGRDDHYWCEAIAQLQGESIELLNPPPAKVSEAPRAKKVPLKDNGVGAKNAKKAKATPEEKAGLAEGGTEAEAKRSKKASTKEGNETTKKSAIVAQPKLAKKTKKAEGAAKTTDAAPARQKKPRKAVPAEDQPPSQ